MSEVAHLDFPEQFDDLWQKIEEIATDVIDKHHECGGGEDAHIIANEVRKLVVSYCEREEEAAVRKARDKDYQWLKEHSYAYEHDVNYQLIDKDEIDEHFSKLEKPTNSGQGAERDNNA